MRQKKIQCIITKKNFQTTLRPHSARSTPRGASISPSSNSILVHSGPWLFQLYRGKALQTRSFPRKPRYCSPDCRRVFGEGAFKHGCKTTVCLRTEVWRLTSWVELKNWAFSHPLHKWTLCRKLRLKQNIDDPCFQCSVPRAPKVLPIWLSQFRLSGLFYRRISFLYKRSMLAHKSKRFPISSRLSPAIRAQTDLHLELYKL